MNWTAIGAMAEVLGAIGVVITLLHISRQVRENTLSIRRSTTHDALGNIADFNQFVASDPQLVDLFWRGTSTPYELSDEEWQRFVSLASTLIRRFELLFLDHAGGTLADDIWEAQANNIRTWMTTPGIVRWLDELGSHVHPRFRRFVTTLPPRASGHGTGPAGQPRPIDAGRSAEGDTDG